MTGEPDFRAILANLSAHNVRFVLIGGLAMVAHGSAHVTRDIDIAYARDKTNVQSLVEALAEFHPRLRGFPEGLPFVWDAAVVRSAANQTLDTEVAEVDVLSDVPGVDSFEAVWSRAVDGELYGIPIRIASIDDLIAMKRVADRPKDRNHIMELEALKRLLEETR